MRAILNGRLCRIQKPFLGASAGASSLASARAIASAVMLAALTAVGMSACGPSLQPAPTPAPVPAATRPEPVVPAVVERVVSTWRLPATLPSTRYLTEISAQLERDSAGRVVAQRAETRALVTLQGRRDSLGAFRGSGYVDSFSVRGLEQVLTANRGDAISTPVPILPQGAMPAGTPTTPRVQFDVTLDPRMLHVAVRPVLANECDRVESAAANMVRDIVVRLPRTIEVGATWSDSTVAFLCRLGVPITSRSKSNYVVERADKVQDRTELVVRRTSTTELAGELRTSWRVLTLAAIGGSTELIRVDALSGIVREAQSDGQLTIKLNDTSRLDGTGAQELRQTTKGRVTLAR